MSFDLVLFAFVATITATSALCVVLARNVVHAAVWLLLTLVGVSLLYFLIGAEFLGSAHLIVYVGGTMVLIVFGVMMTSRGPFDRFRTPPAEWVVGGVLSTAVFVLLVLLTQDLSDSHAGALDTHRPGTGELGLALLGVSDGGAAYLLPFEIVSLHLLVVLVASAYLARANRREGEGPHD